MSCLSFPFVISCFYFLLLLPLHKSYTRVTPLITRQRYHQLYCLTERTSTSELGLIAAVQQYLTKSADNFSPFIKKNRLDEDDRIIICENVTFTTDLVKGEGVAEYYAMAQSWAEACVTELSEASSFVTRVANVRQNVVSVQWNVTFVPDALISLVWLSRRIPGTKLSFFNVLDKERVRSSFSWVSFRAFLERILYTGVVLLPHAVIVGTTELTFRESDKLVDGTPLQPTESLEIVEILDDILLITTESTIRTIPHQNRKKWILSSSKEKINLVRSIDAGLLKNRKLATDLLQFLDARKPATVSLADWNDLLVNRINTRSVPGMGQFDIDGLEAEQQKELLSVSNKILGWATIAVLLFGIAFSTIAFDRLFMYQQQNIDF